MIAWTQANTPESRGEYVVLVGGTKRLATWQGRWFDGYQIIDSSHVRAFIELPPDPEDSAK